MDKVQKIREEVAKRYNYWREKELNSHSIESETRMSECQHLLLMIDSLQEESVSEDFEEALAAEWKGYNDRGAATFDALEDNTQELAFAKGFYRGANWKEQKDSIVSDDLEEAANNAVISLIPSFGQKNSDGSYVSSYRDCFKREEFINLFMAGANWKEQKMMADAIDGKVIANGMGNPILHLWDKGKHLIDKKVKVIVIKIE